MDWYLKYQKLCRFRRARRKEYWMFILVNIIFTFVLGLLDKMLGWQRAGAGQHPDDNLRYSGVFTVVGSSVPPPARHRPLGVVGTAILNPKVYRLAYYHHRPTPCGYAVRNRFGPDPNWNLKTNPLAGCLTHPAFYHHVDE